MDTKSHGFLQSMGSKRGRPIRSEWAENALKLINATDNKSSKLLMSEIISKRRVFLFSEYRFGFLLLLLRFLFVFIRSFSENLAFIRKCVSTFKVACTFSLFSQ